MDLEKKIVAAITRLQKLRTEKRKTYKEPLKAIDELDDIGRSLLKEPTLPEPMRDEPEHGKWYTRARIVNGDIEPCQWFGTKCDRLYLKAGLAFATDKKARTCIDWWNEAVGSK